MKLGQVHANRVRRIEDLLIKLGSDESVPSLVYVNPIDSILIAYLFIERGDRRLEELRIKDVHRIVDLRVVVRALLKTYLVCSPPEIAAL